MNWLNFKTTQFIEPEFIFASMAARGAWLCVIGYCAQRENGGRIVGARHWHDRQWLPACGVTRREVDRASSLLHWEGDDLVVWEYPEAKEREVAQMREFGQCRSERKAEAARENGRLGGRPRIHPAPAKGSHRGATSRATPTRPPEARHHAFVEHAHDFQDRKPSDLPEEAEADESPAPGWQENPAANPINKTQKTHDETERKPKEREEEIKREREKERERGRGPQETNQTHETQQTHRRPPHSHSLALALAPVKIPGEEEFIAECAKHLVPPDFARDRYLAQSAKGWEGVHDWRALARRVKGWFEIEQSTHRPRPPAAPAPAAMAPGASDHWPRRSGVSLVDFATGAILSPPPPRTAT